MDFWDDVGIIKCFFTKILRYRMKFKDEKKIFARINLEGIKEICIFVEK